MYVQKGNDFFMKTLRPHNHNLAEQCFSHLIIYYVNNSSIGHETIFTYLFVYLFIDKAPISSRCDFFDRDTYNVLIKLFFRQ